MRLRAVLPSGRSGLGWPGWGFAWWMYLLALSGAAFMSFGLGHYIGYPHQWLSSRDVWTTTNSAQYVANGGLGYVYSVNPYYSALPGFLVLYAPVVALGQHFNLAISYPFQLPRPSMWLLSGPFFFLVGSTAVFGLDYLAATLGLPTARRKLILVGITLLAVAPNSGWAGHPEDLLALALACTSLAYTIQGRSTAAAWMLCAAIVVQTWAGLLIPVLVVASPAGSRIRTLLRSSAVPALAAVALLAVDYTHASVDLLKQPMTGAGQRLPWYYLASHIALPGWKHLHAISGSPSRSLAVVVAVGAALLIRRSPSPRLIVLAAAVALYARGLFETEFWPYYLAPGAVLLALLVTSETVGRPKRLVTGLVGAFLLYASAPLSYFGVDYSPFLALEILLATGGLCIFSSFPVGHRLARRPLFSRRPAPTAPPPSPELVAQPA